MQGSSDSKRGGGHEARVVPRVLLVVLHHDHDGDDYDDEDEDKSSSQSPPGQKDDDKDRHQKDDDLNLNSDKNDISDGCSYIDDDKLP